MRDSYDLRSDFSGELESGELENEALERHPAPELHLDNRETVETHTAILFLTADRVYKLRKPVDLGFVDLRTRPARLASCENEVRLNRRLAPDVYLGVADIRDEAGHPRDHMVVMRRLPADRRLSELVRGGADLTGELRAIARTMAAFHERCETSPEIARTGGLANLEALWLEAMDAVAPFRGSILDAGTVDEIGRLALRYLAGRGPLLAQRQRAGRIRDGHGDLLADDIYCLGDGPRVLDCINFDRRLRVGDVLADVAFLAMDLERLGAPAAARTFLDAYREFSGETHPASLEHLYIAYRAFVRVRIACIRDHQGDPEAAEEARRLADIALAHLRRGRVRLVLVGGLPGTGKSTLASGLVAARDEWVLLRSDVVRKELAGLAPDVAVEVEPGEGIYSAESTEHGYAELITRARQALENGQSVVLDASWSSARFRELAAEAAKATGADLAQVRCVAPARTAVARIDSRRAVRACGTGGDASDATAAVYASMADRTDPWPAAIDVDTTVSVAETVAAASRIVG
ncbi:bifunctional aminoglycoside phosphotransferase/ATP-binding protein [Parafrankia discariae]|uniref:bifunctional aminoglycoside phosphotransferase/ATP-binding protein n=1 Tax=Parafrankia discariae TaxID=365528 RepID=UPI001E542C24|nr:AAA family ATPase [Parafrankia discariae]